MSGEIVAKQHRRIRRLRAAEGPAIIAVLVTMVGLLVAVQADARQQSPPIIDMHLHALRAADQGPPPLGFCPSNPDGFPVWDARRPYPDVFLERFKKPPCADPIWSPATDDELLRQTIDVLRRRNIVAVASGPLVDQYHAAAPDRIIPGAGFVAGEAGKSPAELRAIVKSGRAKVLGEIGNQYHGIEPDDPAFEPYLALAEELDVPVGLHVGTGPPGAIYLGSPKYRARMHSALTLEDALVRHPRLRLYVMHAGWPMIDDMLAVMWAHPQVHVDTGIIVYALPKPEFYRYLQRIVEAGFGKRVMFGSDQMVWPGAIEYGISVIEQAPFLSAEQKRDILYNNAARFLRLNGAK